MTANEFQNAMSDWAWTMRAIRGIINSTTADPEHKNYNAFKEVRKFFDQLHQDEMKKRARRIRRRARKG